ncbi:hypothetical protein LEP1GSC202_0757 [Leptospira yanagawae serovar Saopaulo str. Sao Paulo = ATCC 700523]|uniref:Uncharacterized protein n=1 Tax=Leptospira yanagawae serovar Saopaulo str. Sao Paulo = ATCC 700523 TaxID=1249483 RepID=A0A5E8HDG9_9LEPT|nr:hypothetical protein LEP1GSC202_0757 [Leptospira yanagawae serovar Saopaulo str. Sao Paulo = ATCC 700523]
MVSFRWIAGLLTLVLTTQFFFLGSGLLGYCLETNSKICKCNHGSKKEKHTNSEDQLFSESQNIKITSSEEKNHAHTKELALKPSCHDAKDGEAHLCSCKKKKKDAMSLRTHHQTMDQPNLTFGIAVPILYFYKIYESPSTLEDGNLPTLLRPPRIT